MSTYRQKLSFVLFLSLAMLLLSADKKAHSVKWLDWDKAYKKAEKKKRKILLVDTYTDWCGWCKKMDKDTYADPKIAKKIKKHFIPVKFNPEAKGTYHIDGKEYNGRQLLKRLASGQGVGYPTTFFLDIKDNKVKKISGYLGPNDFGALLDEMTKWAKD